MYVCWLLKSSTKRPKRRVCSENYLNQNWGFASSECLFRVCVCALERGLVFCLIKKVNIGIRRMAVHHYNKEPKRLLRRGEVEGGGLGEENAKWFVRGGRQGR